MYVNSGATLERPQSADLGSDQIINSPCVEEAATPRSAVRSRILDEIRMRIDPNQESPHRNSFFYNWSSSVTPD